MDALFEKGREGFLDGTIDWDTNVIKAMLADLDTAATANKAITGATNASPISITATAHGFATGDIVHIRGVGGNTAANNVWTITVVDANTFTLNSSTGNGAYTSGGTALCLGPSAAADNLDDVSAMRVGTDQTLTSPTVTAGVADAADSTWTSVTGATVEAIILYKDTGTPGTSRLIAVIDGKQKVTCNTQAAAAATSIAVEPLRAGIANGAVLVFSNGASATLSAAANAGDRSLTVSALAAIITAGAFATAAINPASGLPVTPNGGNITATYDNGSNRIFKL